MRVKEQISVPVAGSAAGVAASQALAGAGPLTLTANPVNLTGNGNGNPGSPSEASSPPYNPTQPGSGLKWNGYVSGGSRLVFTSTANESGVSFTIVGTDFAGNPQTEVLAGPATPATVTSVLDYATVISITASGAVTNIGVGWGTEYITPWIQVGNFRGHMQTYWSVNLLPGTTANYNLEATDSPLNRPDKNYTGKYSDNVIILASAQTASLNGVWVAPYTFVRLRINSQSGGNVTFRVIPSRTV